MRVSDSRVLRRLFGPKWKEIIREGIKLYNELNDLYCSPNIFRMIKSRRIKWARHVARMGDRSVGGNELSGSIKCRNLLTS
jgi:hypothetical protein